MKHYLESIFGLEGRTALVTGASGGIGRALAVGLAGAGARVAVHGRNMNEIEETISIVNTMGGSAVPLQADLQDHSACNDLIEAARHHMGKLDILVNCAGINRRKLIEQVTEDDWETILTINLKSVFFLSMQAYRLMRQQSPRGGKIVHVASLTSFIGLGGTSVYGMTKAAVAQLARTQAVEWAKDNVQVNALAPGFIRTPLTETSLWADDRKRSWLLDRIPARRPGAAQDMVSALLFLVAPASSYTTGQTIVVDGGFLAGGSWEEQTHA